MCTGAELLADAGLHVATGDTSDKRAFNIINCEMFS